MEVRGFGDVAEERVCVGFYGNGDGGGWWMIGRITEVRGLRFSYWKSRGVA
jgi:hypothetical protein